MFEFSGQQEDEVILYEIRPHWIRKTVGLVKAICLTVLGIFITHFFENSIGSDPRYTFTFGVISSMIIGGVFYGWVRFTANRARAYITDRRFIRLEVAFPAFLSRRSLFWNEVLKVKSISPNIFFRYLKIGNLVISPIMSTGSEDVSVRYVYYYVDLANYIEKIMYTVKTKPAEIAAIRPFVPRPAGERY